MSLADSIRQTASIARWASEPVTAPDYSTSGRIRVGRSAVRGRGYWFAATCSRSALLLLPQLGRELGAEVLGLEHLADLDLGSPPSGWGSA